MVGITTKSGKRGRGVGVEVKGLDTIQKNLSREIKRMKGDTTKGIRIAFAWLWGRIIPVTPVEFSFLRNSKFTQVFQTKRGTDAALGFTIDYAPFVHENINAIFKSPGTGAKFLEKPIMENQRRILEIVRNEAKV